LPVSLGIIERKLDNGEFENLAEVEGYVKRMISNAKEFYAKNSTIFDDAERVRKALSNFMTKRNPAYQTRGYQAAPAPLPDDGGAEDEDEDEDDEEDADGEAAEEEQEEDDEEEEEEEEVTRGGSKRRSIILKRRGSERQARTSISVQPQPSPRVSSTNAKQDHAFENIPYKSLGFQEAQEKLVEELLRYHTPEYVHLNAMTYVMSNWS
jgi:cobalamin biosynthesis protein CobT